MRPKYLELSAWGPYRDKVAIDFEVFDKGALFLISGPTGAGKTTVFDGICFAIYGDTSGKEREKNTLRSDFAQPDTATYVHFIFTHNGLTYEVRRNPEYQRPRKRKNAEGALTYTTEKENAVLKLPDGNILEGVTTVNKKLQELMALDYSQFKQISMIAQGEFDRLLTAPSQEKTKIFRGIFGTEKYDLFTQVLKVRSAAAYRKVSEYTSRMKEDIKIYAKGDQELESLAHAEHIHFDTVEEVMQQRKKQLAADKKRLAKELSICEEALNKQYAVYNQVQEQRNKQEQLRKAKERYCQLQNTRDQYEAAKMRLIKGREARGLEREYENRQEADRQLRGFGEAAAKARKELETAREQYLEVEAGERQAYEDWQQADRAYKRASIGIVADMLEYGKPCPVCGSLEHPMPFVSNGTVPDLQQVERLKKIHEKEKKKQLTVYGQVQACLETHKRAELQQQEGVKLHAEREKEWLEKLNASSFVSQADFLEARLTQEAEKTYQEKVSKWEEMITHAKAIVEHLTEELAQMPVLDIEAVEQSYDLAKTERDRVRREEQQVLLQETQIKNGLKSIQENHKLSEEYRREFGIIKDLENLAAGNNGKRLVFEQYVLSNYFEDILAAANIRFRHMTMDRYEMVRKAEVTDARTKDHLDIMIVDYYTGKTRPVSTLSGGERFHASLSLALGMSDVIQAYQGGIRVETLFVDEGFGSLDEDALQAACDSLYQLTEGDKLVGIISHVDSLKQRIDNRIEICKTNIGSTLKVVAGKG